MKTIKELNALSEELGALCGKLAELNEDELSEVTGGKRFIGSVRLAEILGCPDPYDEQIVNG